MTPGQLTDYDRIRYPSYTHPQTHPDRMAVIGRLFGLEPPPVNRCRVLEIGCGDGGNLAPMAWTMPESQLVGIDLAGEPVKQGQQMAKELELRNLRLVQGDLVEIGAEWGQFDYIIAHGIFSWVPVPVRARILEICRERLTPHGVAFVSYNAFPGCHLRNMVREMMLFHLRGTLEPQERVQQAAALVGFLAQAQDTTDEYRLWMKAELERIQEHAPGHLYHDELASVNEPYYFTQFMAEAARHGLQYLGEADFFEMSDHIFHEAVRETLGHLGKNRLMREQYLDFLKCRRFRQTLLCRAEAVLRTEPIAGQIASFFIGAGTVARNGAVDLAPGVNCVFETPKGAKCQTDLAAGKAALSILGERWPAPLAFDVLVTTIRQRLDAAALHEAAAKLSPEAMCDFLLRLYAGGVVEFRTWLPPVAGHAAERPVVYPVARWQAAHGRSAASLFHIAVNVEDEVGRALLSWLDGSLDRAAVLERLWELLKSRNALNLQHGGEAGARKELEAKLEENLQKLARLGLLVEPAS